MGDETHKTFFEVRALGVRWYVAARDHRHALALLADDGGFVEELQADGVWIREMAPAQVATATVLEAVSTPTGGALVSRIPLATLELGDIACSEGP